MAAMERLIAIRSVELEQATVAAAAAAKSATALHAPSPQIGPLHSVPSAQSDSEAPVSSATTEQLEVDHAASGAGWRVDRARSRAWQVQARAVEASDNPLVATTRQDDRVAECEEGMLWLRERALRHRIRSEFEWLARARHFAGGDLHALAQLDVREREMKLRFGRERTALELQRTKMYAASLQRRLCLLEYGYGLERTRQRIGTFLKRCLSPRSAAAARTTLLPVASPTGAQPPPPPPPAVTAQSAGAPSSPARAVSGTASATRHSPDRLLASITRDCAELRAIYARYSVATQPGSSRAVRDEDDGTQPLDSLRSRTDAPSLARARPPNDDVGRSAGEPLLHEPLGGTATTDSQGALPLAPPSVAPEPANVVGSGAAHPSAVRNDSAAAVEVHASPAAKHADPAVRAPSSRSDTVTTPDRAAIGADARPAALPVDNEPAPALCVADVAPAAPERPATVSGDEAVVQASPVRPRSAAPGAGDRSPCALLSTVKSPPRGAAPERIPPPSVAPAAGGADVSKSVHGDQRPVILALIRTYCDAYVRTGGRPLDDAVLADAGRLGSANESTILLVRDTVNAILCEMHGTTGAAAASDSLKYAAMRARAQADLARPDAGARLAATIGARLSAMWSIREAGDGSARLLERLARRDDETWCDWTAEAEQVIATTSEAVFAEVLAGVIADAVHAAVRHA